MNEMEKQFQRIVDDLAINDQPNEDHARQLRQQMLAACRQTPQGTVRPFWKLTLRAAAAIILIAGALLTVWNMERSDIDDTGITHTSSGAEHNTHSAARQSPELKQAIQYYNAKDSQALATLLETANPETKLAIVNYLKSLGTDEAAKLLDEALTIIKTHKQQPSSPEPNKTN